MKIIERLHDSERRNLWSIRWAILATLCNSASIGAAMLAPDHYADLPGWLRSGGAWVALVSSVLALVAAILGGEWAMTKASPVLTMPADAPTAKQPPVNPV